MTCILFSWLQNYTRMLSLGIAKWLFKKRKLVYRQMVQVINGNFSSLSAEMKRLFLIGNRTHWPDQQWQSSHTHANQSKAELYLKISRQKVNELQKAGKKSSGRLPIALFLSYSIKAKLVWLFRCVINLLLHQNASLLCPNTCWWLRLRSSTSYPLNKPSNFIYFYFPYFFEYERYNTGAKIYINLPWTFPSSSARSQLPIPTVELISDRAPLFDNLWTEGTPENSMPLKLQVLPFESAWESIKTLTRCHDDTTFSFNVLSSERGYETRGGLRTTQCERA